MTYYSPDWLVKAVSTIQEQKRRQRVMTDLEILVISLLIGLLLGWCGKSARDQDAPIRRYKRLIRRAKRGQNHWQD